MDRDELKIIRTYQTIVRGIIQYFCLANNLTVLTHLNYLAEYSCLKTLARKRKRQLPKFERKVKLVQLGGFLILIKGKPNTNHGIFTLGTKLKKCVTIRETRTLP
ncbi:MAG: group II intron reverse transcriptase/maturase [Pigeon pea little leaf phytoplasma]|nr:group II intron reverse transcriptase/maturase [Pigeon pea little leaf phytoplasma]MDV3161535.1 group II intron reverse transcriptase/maturase [Pigeon pea little leaf phytoplasma]